MRNLPANRQACLGRRLTVLSTFSMDANARSQRSLGSLIFLSRWLQAPL